jgi:3-hydroxyisobutyrate dehydrogenase-like beta-hydroxyacid dehydrogenase
MARLGFIGLGQMGAAMAANLVAAGHEVTVFNRSREKSEALAGQGAKVAGTAAEACRGAEAVFTMLANDEALEAVAFGHDGLIAGLESQTRHVSSSTVSVRLMKRLAEAHGAKGQKLVSCPVFGRPNAAAARKLVIAAGGAEEDIEAIRPFLEAMGRAVYVAGKEPWQANLFKLCGNFMIASTVELLGETFATLRKAGADHGQFAEVISDVFGSPLVKNYSEIVVNEKFDPAAFVLRLGFKDVRLMLEAAQDLTVPMPIASVVRDQYLSALAHGQDDLDWSSVAKVAARSAGLDS